MYAERCRTYDFPMNTVRHSLTRANAALHDPSNHSLVAALVDAAYSILDDAVDLTTGVSH